MCVLPHLQISAIDVDPPHQLFPAVFINANNPLALAARETSNLMTGSLYDSICPAGRRHTVRRYCFPPCCGRVSRLVLILLWAKRRISRYVGSRTESAAFRFQLLHTAAARARSHKQGFIAPTPPSDLCLALPSEKAVTPRLPSSCGRSCLDKYFLRVMESETSWRYWKQRTTQFPAA